MTAIRLAEQGQRADGSFDVMVSIGEAAEYEVSVVDATEPTAEKNMAWYFEEHLRFPFLDKDRERQAEAQIAAYGLALFAQVFGGAAGYDYRRLRDRAFDGCRLEVSGSSAFHRLHWEVLRDPEIAEPLAIRLPITRRVRALGSRFELADDRPTLNILVVTARPDGPADVGYRTISRPLLDTIRRAELPVKVDLVRPGTWEAVGAQLLAATERHGSGWYQVIHFDLHGALAEFAGLDEQRRNGRLVFRPEVIEPFTGQRSFLFFETPEQGQAAPVPATAVASLLAQHRVPVAVLNACQSAMQTAASEASLAQHLAEAGVPVTMGMAYSVTVSAAARAMPVLYERLADGAEPTTAVHAARRELYEHQGRQAYFDQQIELEDWMLPVVFAQRPLSLRLREMTVGEQAEFYQREAAVGDEPPTEYGFVGRDLDIQAIERALLSGSDSNQLLLQGMAGAGKSTLLHHLGWWWQRTSLVDQVFRFSYEDRAWTAAQMIREIRSRLLIPVEQARADAMPDAAQLEQAARLLRATRHLLIIDNAESITASPAAIPHALPPGERDRLKTFLSRLRGGRTLVLVGSRESETWLTADNSGPATYQLPGLDPQAASVLVDRILRRHGGARYLQDSAQRAALQDLVKLLGGYPLPLTVVLPYLATASPSTVLDELRVGGPSADPAGLIRHAIEYSHGKLDPAIQNSLLLLAPFTAVIPTNSLLDRYRDLLRRDKAVRQLGQIDLGAALDQALSVGLAVSHSQLGGTVQVQPTLPYFLRSRLRDLPSLQAAADQAHYEFYSEFASGLHGMLVSGSDPQHRALGQTATRAHYANLTAAITHGLGTRRPVAGIVAALEEFLDQTKQPTARRRLLDDAIAASPKPLTREQRRELAHLHNLAGTIALDQRRFDDARTNYQSEMRLRRAIGDRRNQAVMYHQLGRVAQEQGKLKEAEENYRQALAIELQFGDRDRAARACHQLGEVALEQGKLKEAEENYRQALDLHQKLGDQWAAALTYHELGMLAEEQGRFEEAEARYRKSLAIKLQFGDRHGAALTYNQIGKLAHMSGQLEVAGKNYREALAISLEIGEKDVAAANFHNLGSLAQAQQRPEEAEANYRKAIAIKLELGDRYEAAGTYHELGYLLQEQGRLEEAEENYRQALPIFKESNERNASTTAWQLGIVLHRLNRHAEATQMFLYALFSWRRFTGEWRSPVLQWLKLERRVMGAAEFHALAKGIGSHNLSEELANAIDEAEELSADS